MLHCTGICSRCENREISAKQKESSRASFNILYISFAKRQQQRGRMETAWRKEGGKN